MPLTTPLHRLPIQTSYQTSFSVDVGMKSWPVQHAKARFSELLETCLREGPQVVTKRGADAAVLVPVSDWQKLQRAAKPTLKKLLLSDGARGELNVPKRGRRRRREPRELV